MRKCEKTESMSWKECLRKIQQAFRDLENFGIKFEDKVVGIEMIDGTNLDAGTKRKKFGQGKETHIQACDRQCQATNGSRHR